jgi:hypothetical protein
VALPLTICLFASREAVADEAEKPAFSPLARRLLTWLPEDTESIVAGQSFTMPTKSDEEKLLPGSGPSEAAFATAMSARALGVLINLDGKILQPLTGRKIALALRGNRYFDWVSASLPTHRSESCSIIVFDEKLGLAQKQLTDLLRAGPEETRKIVGREVFVFPASRQMRQDRAWKWRGTLGIYVVLLDSETLLCATSDTYLEDTLKRMDAKAARWGIPENLEIWKHLDPRAPAWMVWQPSAILKKYGGEPLVDGIAWTVRQDSIRAIYLPTEPIAERLERTTRKIWNFPNQAVQPTIERLKNNMVVVSSSTKDLNTLDQFSLAFILYQLEAANCGLDPE